VPPVIRRAQILEQIQRDGGVSIADLARAHGVSPVTVHRDLEQLASEGLVERIHGGARTVQGGDGPRPPATAWTKRVIQAGGAKTAIAEHAARLVANGSTIFLDASSSALALARRLAEHPPNELTLVTNSPAIVHEITSEPIHVVACPGELDQHMRMLTGRWTVEFLEQLNFDVAFISAAGVTLDAGLTTARRPLAEVLLAAAGNAEKTVGLIDATKFGRAALLSIMPAQQLDLILTDGSMDRAVAQDYAAAGVRLETVNE
jgi:DeoR family fructose operon transcriptional repressor